MAKKKVRAAPKPRDIMIVDLRRQGYTYDAIAHELHKAGILPHVVCRVYIGKLVRKLCPQYMGSIKHRYRLEKLVHVKDIVNVAE